LVGFVQRHDPVANLKQVKQLIVLAALGILYRKVKLVYRLSLSRLTKIFHVIQKTQLDINVIHCNDGIEFGLTGAFKHFACQPKNLL
jgi:hypothetical protein